MSPSELEGYSYTFGDDRLTELLPLYKARNFPSILTPGEREKWLQHCRDKLLFGAEEGVMGRFFAELELFAAKDDLTPEQKFIIEELNLWGQDVAGELMTGES